jgi:hypothetical protein
MARIEARSRIKTTNTALLQLGVNDPAKIQVNKIR